MMTNSAGFKGVKPTTMLTMPFMDIVLSRLLLVAFHEIGVQRSHSLESSLGEELVYEGLYFQPDLGPERLVIRFEDGPLQAAKKAFLNEQGGPPNGDVLVFIGQLAGSPHGSRPPSNTPGQRKCP